MTTRNKKTNLVQQVFTWFKWNQCCNCKKEFRREHGYSSYIKPPRNSIVDTRYLCKTCGSSFEHADILFRKMRRDFMEAAACLPKPPPPPPKKRL